MLPFMLPFTATVHSAITRSIDFSNTYDYNNARTKKSAVRQTLEQEISYE